MHPIISNAKQYIGKEEIPGNKGFLDPEFDKKMRSIGWITGWAWCMAFCRLNYLEIYPQFSDMIKRNIGFGVINTFTNCSKEPFFTIVQEPEEGGIVCWSTGKGNGHCGLVETKLQEHQILDIEGNTNKKGGREGLYVLEKARYYMSISNWKYLGCITIK